MIIRKITKVVLEPGDRKAILECVEKIAEIAFFKISTTHDIPLFRLRADDRGLAVLDAEDNVVERTEPYCDELIKLIEGFYRDILDLDG
jgi:hypothetical protein